MRWRAYLSILRIRLITGLQYRVAALAGVAIHLFWGFILTTILIFFYELGQRQNLTMTLAQGVTYIWLGQCFINLIPLQMDTEIYQKITTGDFAYDLCRPLDLYSHWFARILAIRLSNTILKSGFVLLVIILLPAPYAMSPPVSWLALLATIIALLGALLLSCVFTNFMNTFFLWIELGPGLNSLFLSIIIVLSGSLIPLAVFPDWLQPILRLLPFAGLIDFPNALYTGIIHVSEAWTLFARQIFWIIAFVILGRWRLYRGIQRTVIQGG